MRKAVLLGVIGALTLSATAYGAVTITNVYVAHGNITPVKAGTKVHPVPIGGHVDFKVTTQPKGHRPNLIKTIQLRVQGIIQNTSRFPACGTARLNDPSQGPGTCPAGSKFATGFLMVDISKQGDQTSPPILTCRADVSLYNGGNATVSYYVYKGTEANACPLASNEAFDAALTQTKRGLVDSATFPQDLRHPTVAGVSYDAAVVQGSINISIVKKTVRVGKGKRAKRETIGLFASTSCPANHQRQVALTFLPENGNSRTVTRLVACR